MTARRSAIAAAEAAIARGKLEARLTGMRARGEAVAAEREPPVCCACPRRCKGEDDFAALERISGVYVCPRCYQLSMDAGGGARVVTRKGRDV